MRNTTIRSSLLVLGVTLAVTGCSGTVDSGWDSPESMPSAPSPTPGPSGSVTGPAAPTGMPGMPATSTPKPPATVPMPPAPSAMSLPPEPAKCLKPGTTVKPTRVSAMYMNACAGCHGASGEGRGAEYPALAATKLPFEEFLKVVRQGRIGKKMPNFSPEQISDGHLVEDWATLTNKTLMVPASLSCASVAAPNAQALETAIQTGLASWTKEDAHGFACVHCHTPDGFDLAYISYRDSDIMRRALLHVSEQDAHNIVGMVHAYRQKYSLPFRDPTTFRPFQPGGRTLGDMNEAFETKLRWNKVWPGDALFLEHWRKAVPTLAGPPITTLEQAKKARDELVAINVREFPVAIAFNRWTEDSFHGADRRNVQEWITAEPMRAKTPEGRAAIEAARKAYVANPSWATLAAYMKAIDDHVPMEALTDDGRVPFVFKQKYMGVQVAQHIFRLEAQGQRFVDMPINLAKYNEELSMNPIWEAGFAAKRSGDPGALVVPKEVMANVPSVDVLGNDLYRVRTTWFFAGYLIDQPLKDSGGSNSTTAMEYFTQGLNWQGYLAHSAYAKLTKYAARAFKPGGGGDRYGVQRVANGGNFQFWGRFPMPEASLLNGPDAAWYKNLTSLVANAVRMFALLATEDIARTGSVSNPESLGTGEQSLYGNDGMGMQRFLDAASAFQPEARARDVAIVGELKKAVASCTDLGRDRYACSYKP